MFFKIGALNNFAIFAEKHQCWSSKLTLKVDLEKGLQACKETSTHVLSCEYCEIFMSTFFYRIPPLAASAVLKN